MDGSEFSQMSKAFNVPTKVPDTGCKGYKEWTDFGYEYDCGYDTTLDCGDCKYCKNRVGRGKDPEAKCNQIK